MSEQSLFVRVTWADMKPSVDEVNLMMDIYESKIEQLRHQHPDRELVLMGGIMLSREPTEPTGTSAVIRFNFVSLPEVDGARVNFPTREYLKERLSQLSTRE